MTPSALQWGLVYPPSRTATPKPFPALWKATQENTSKPCTQLELAQTNCPSSWGNRKPILEDGIERLTATLLFRLP